MRDLDASPIVRVVEARGGIGPTLGIDPGGTRPAGVRDGRRHDDPDVKRWVRAYQRMRTSRYVTPWMADRFCIEVLAVHPGIVMGRAWWDAIPEPDRQAEAWASGATV